MVMYDNDHHAWAGCAGRRWRGGGGKFNSISRQNALEILRSPTYVGVDTLLKYFPRRHRSVSSGRNFTRQ